MPLNWKNEDGRPAYPSHRTIAEWCRCLGVRCPPRRGWFRVPGTNRWLWFPHAEAAKWQNGYDQASGEIDELFVGDEADRRNRTLLDAANRAKVEQGIGDVVSGREKERLVFFNDNRNAFGIPALENGYGFVGVFRIDPEKSRREGKCVYRRIADSVELPLNG